MQAFRVDGQIGCSTPRTQVNRGSPVAATTVGHIDAAGDRQFAILGRQENIAGFGIDAAIGRFQADAGNCTHDHGAGVTHRHTVADGSHIRRKPGDLVI